MTDTDTRLRLLREQNALTPSGFVTLAIPVHKYGL